MKTNAVIDRPEAVVAVAQDMAGFAVAVVDDQIKGRDAPEQRMQRLFVLKSEIVLVEVGLDKELHRTLAVRPNTQHSRGHQRPAKSLADQIGGQFPIAQRAMGKIPQRRLALARLVDCQRLEAIAAKIGQKRVV